MDITEAAESAGDSLAKVAEMLWDLMTVDRSGGHATQVGDRDQIIQDLQEKLLDSQHSQDLTNHDLESMFDRLVEQNTALQHDGASGLHAPAVPTTVRSAAVPTVQASHTVAAAPVHTAAPVHIAAPAPTVIRQIVERPVIVDRPVIHTVTEQRVVHVTEQVHTQQVSNNSVTNNSVTNVVHEGSTVVDNRTITTITAKGDVSFDQRVDNHTVTAGKGGVAVGGDVDHAAVNTGVNTGQLAGGDVHVEDSVIGDGNTQVNDSHVGALSGKGNATNIAGQQVNTGSGDLVSAHANGDAQVVSGNGNKLSGDSDVDFDKADGPVNAAVGHDIRQSAAEDSSVHETTSDTIDHKVTVSEQTSLQQTDNSQNHVAAAVNGQGNDLQVAPDQNAPLGSHPTALPEAPADHPALPVHDVSPAPADAPAQEAVHAPVEASQGFDGQAHGLTFVDDQQFGAQDDDGRSFEDGHPFAGGLDDTQDNHGGLQDVGHHDLGFDPDDLDD